MFYVDFANNSKKRLNWILRVNGVSDGQLPVFLKDLFTPSLG